MAPSSGLVVFDTFLSELRLGGEQLLGEVIGTGPQFLGFERISLTDQSWSMSSSQYGLNW